MLIILYIIYIESKSNNSNKVTFVYIIIKKMKKKE